LDGAGSVNCCCLLWVGIGGWLVLVDGAAKCVVINKFVFKHHSFHLFIVVVSVGVVIGMWYCVVVIVDMFLVINAVKS